MTKQKTKTQARPKEIQAIAGLSMERLDPEARARLFQMEYVVLRNKYGIEYAADLKYSRMGIQLQVEPMMVLQPVPDWQPPQNGTNEPDE